jgi:flagellar biosynthesis/type III secretory pathway M-ring protein FliF/YscJ
MSTESESDRLLEAQSKVKQVEDITRENLAKVANRGENLDDLQRRTDVLSQSASEFSYTARRIQQKYCWQNVKLWIVILFILIIILVVLIIALVAAINH